MSTVLLVVGSAVVGLVTAPTAGRLMRGNGFGLLGDVIAGVFGAVVGGYALDVGGMDFGVGFAGRLVVALIGAVIVLLLVHELTGRRGGHRMWS